MTEIVAIATVPAVVALVELAKGLGLPARLAPLAAVLLGIGAQLLEAVTTGASLTAAVPTGLILGLTASGLWDIAGRVRPEPEPTDA